MNFNNTGFPQNLKVDCSYENSRKLKWRKAKKQLLCVMKKGGAEMRETNRHCEARPHLWSKEKEPGVAGASAD